MRHPAYNPARIILADPPWQFGDRLPGPKRGASKHYRTMSTLAIAALQLPPIADDALLFLWRVAAMQPDALTVVRAWGFEVKSELVWIKTGPRMGMGHYTRLDHEVCLIATRGHGITLIANHATRSVVQAPRGKHSEKPPATYEAIEQLVGSNGPKVELFARRHRPGWVCIGTALGTTLEPRR
ncbi:MAG: MT-A70 family methyltransferase [Dehalococcoidia bacterium]|jgi:site-specific DNA-methyltransferase (adenine-specific)|nr:MT-A70 family methyltransferase [Dehalococcoidia bacterium]